MGQGECIFRLTNHNEICRSMKIALKSEIFITEKVNQLRYKTIDLEYLKKIYSVKNNVYAVIQLKKYIYIATERPSTVRVCMTNK